MSTAQKPGGLLERHKLLGAVITAKWAKRLDISVSYHVIERYFQQYGNSRVALSYLEKATGAGRSKITASLRKIMAKGVFSIARQGIGTRPTEYALNFDYITEPARGAQSGTSTSGDQSGTTEVTNPAPLEAPSGAQSGTQTYLPMHAYSMHTVGKNIDPPAAASPPPLAGLTPATAETARDPKEKTPSPFEELWAVFPRKHQRSKARAEYDKLAPDADLHRRLLDSATAWAEHYKAHATEKRWWKHLHTWLAEERYLEDLPEPYENAKDAAIAKARERGPRKASQAEASQPDAVVSGVPKGTPPGRHVVEIVGSDVEGAGQDNTFLSFSYRIRDGKHDGVGFTHKFLYWSYDPDRDLEIEQGQRFFADLRQATKIENPIDTHELDGSVICAIVSKGGAIKYEPAKDSERGLVHAKQDQPEPAPEPEATQPERRPQYGVPIEVGPDGIWGIALARY